MPDPAHTSIDRQTQMALEALKISALATGLRVDDAVIASLGGASALTRHEYSTTGGIPLRVGPVFLNVPFDEWFCESADIDLLRDGHGRLVLCHDGLDHVVDEVYSLPSYLGDHDDDGLRYDEVVFSHMDRARLSPIAAGCAFDCAFCDMASGRVRVQSVERLVRSARRALADEALPARHLLISGGSPGPRDRELFASTVCAVAAELAPYVEVDVMMASGPDTAELVDRLVDAGVSGFALNMELFSEEASMLHIRGKHRRARPHYDETVRAAVARLGSTGCVRALILPGLEPVSATLEGVEHIASLGADPVLSPFRPARDTRLSASPPVDAAQLRSVLEGARQIAQRYGVRLGPRCVPCQHNTLTFPWDVR